MKYLVIFLLALIATTYSAPTCSAYCTSVMANCLTTNVQYTDNTDCMNQCALFPLGTDADMAGNTVGCRTYHAGAAASDAATHCIHAGPTGGGPCGAACDAYCNLTAACTGANKFFPDYAFCMKACPNFNSSDKFGDKAGNGLFCHTYHAGAAATDANTHCAHASPSGNGACGSKCDNYCAISAKTCSGTNSLYSDAPTCMGFCSSLPNGNINDTSGNTVDCRIYHALAASVTGDVSHCPHASHSGGTLCGSYCDVYCQLAIDHCTGANMIYTDKAACMSACTPIAATGKPGDTSGDTIQCRIYHLGAAKALNDAATHCPHGKVSSATCGGGNTMTTTTSTMSTTSSKTDKTGNAFGVVVSFVTLIGFLLF